MRLRGHDGRYGAPIYVELYLAKDLVGLPHRGGANPTLFSTSSFEIPCPVFDIRSFERRSQLAAPASMPVKWGGTNELRVENLQPGRHGSGEDNHPPKAHLLLERHLMLPDSHFGIADLGDAVDHAPERFV
jgi:hypothetical protein